MPTDFSAPVARATRSWLEPHRFPAASSHDEVLAQIQENVASAVIDYHDRGIAAVDLQPGNGTRYIVVLTALDRLSRPAGHDDSGWYAAVDAPVAFGGDLLVSLPEFHRSTIVSTGSLHFPDYVDEKMSLGHPHSAVVAVFLTLFDDALTLTPSDA